MFFGQSAVRDHSLCLNGAKWRWGEPRRAIRVPEWEWTEVGLTALGLVRDPKEVIIGVGGTGMQSCDEYFSSALSRDLVALC
jgi:hypothetical protein